jgi:hypothetical protein
MKEKNHSEMCLTLISGFRRDVHEICGLLGYYAASCRSVLILYSSNLFIYIFNFYCWFIWDLFI